MDAIDLAAIQFPQPPELPLDCFEYYLEEQLPRYEADGFTPEEARTEIFKAWEQLTPEQKEYYCDLSDADVDQFEVENAEYIHFLRTVNNIGKLQCLVKMNEGGAGAYQGVGPAVIDGENDGEVGGIQADNDGEEEGGLLITSSEDEEE